MTTKSPDAFRTISEVAEWLGVPTHVLRLWESRFSQVKPVKRAGGRRYYRPSDMELLGGIRKLLHDDGMTIRGVQKLLREEGVKHVAALSPGIDEPVMRDVTPSNVVELERAKPGPKPAAVEDAEVVPEPEPVLQAEPEPALAEPEDVQAEPEVAQAEPAHAPEPEEPEQTPEPPSEQPPEMPEEIPAGEPDETPVPTPEEIPQEGPVTPDMPDAPQATEGDLFDSPEGIDFLAHDADIAPPETDETDLANLAALDGVEDAAGLPEPPAPGGVDISHIPDDPADEDVTPSGSPGTSAALRQARVTGRALHDPERLKTLARRLTVLRDRMKNGATRPHP